MALHEQLNPPVLRVVPAKLERELGLVPNALLMEWGSGGVFDEAVVTVFSLKSIMESGSWLFGFTHHNSHEPLSVIDFKEKTVTTAPPQNAVAAFQECVRDENKQEWSKLH